MKMQKTEMEFVTFEAQDVIMTSGTPVPVKGQGMKAQIQTIYAYNQANPTDILYNSTGGTNGLDNPNKQLLWLTYLDDETLTQAQGQATADEPLGDFFLADTIQTIEAWLETQRMQ